MVWVKGLIMCEDEVLLLLLEECTSFLWLCGISAFLETELGRGRSNVEGKEVVLK